MPEPEPAPPAFSQPEPEPEPPLAALATPEPEPAPPTPAYVAATAYRVSIRMDDGEQVAVATHGDESAARAEATALMRYLRDGRGDWPFVGGRFLRPERIVSIDVDEV